MPRLRARIALRERAEFPTVAILRPRAFALRSSLAPRSRC